MIPWFYVEGLRCVTFTVVLGIFNFRCKSLEFQLCDFLKTNTGNHMFGNLFPIKSPSFLFNLSACSTIIYHKRISTPVFFSEPFRFSLFFFVFFCFTQLVPQISPQTKNQASQQASNQSTKGMAAATDPSTTGRGQYILSRPHRGGKGPGISTAWI